MVFQQLNEALPNHARSAKYSYAKFFSHAYLDSATRRAVTAVRVRGLAAFRAERLCLSEGFLLGEAVG